MSDEHFRQAILDALDRSASDREFDLSDQKFEQCMVEMLEPVFPGIVWVLGGNDGGMDGAIPDHAGGGPAHPLVCTIEEDAIGNLTRSLRRQRVKNPGADKTVFATTRPLTAERRRNLTDRAEELGFTLLQIYERASVASLLCRHPRWAKALLGVSGDLPALSPLPPRLHNATVDRYGDPPVGRATDLEHLRESSNDVVLVGPPGSGKKFLLAHLARQGWGVFAHGDDATAVLDAIREQQPPRVIVTDAREHRPLLQQLVRARNEARFEYALIVTGLEEDETDIRADLGRNVLVHKLELLTRDEVVEVYHALGIRCDAERMRWLVDQADNKPGLAATLAAALRDHDYEGVVRGDVLREHIIRETKSAVGDVDVPLFLAAFAFGGDAGMKREAVATVLNQSLGSTRRAASILSSCGVLSNKTASWGKPTGALCVRPVILRAALFRQEDVAEMLANSDRFAGLVDAAPDLGDVAQTLAGAVALGADIPSERLRPLVEQHGTRRAWETLAGVDACADWVLESYPHAIQDIAEAAFKVRPVEVIQRLFEAGHRAQGDQPTTADSIIGVIERWLREVRTGSAGQGPVERRRLVVEQCVRFEQRHGAAVRPLAQTAVLAALSPELEEWVSDPGLGQTARRDHRVLTVDDLRSLEQVWSFGKHLFAPLALPWPEVNRRLRVLIHPNRIGVPLEASQLEVIRDLGGRILRHLWDEGQLDVGARVAANRLATKVDTGFPEDDEMRCFALVFPDDSTPYDTLVDPTSLHELAAKQAASSPDCGAQWLARMTAEADAIQQTWPRRTPQLCELIALRVDNVTGWIDALRKWRTTSKFVKPFLTRLLQERPEGWIPYLTELLDSEETQQVALELALRENALPEPVEARLLEMVPEFAETVFCLTLRHEMPAPRLASLLVHEDAAVRLAALTGEWAAEPRRVLVSPLLDVWRSAVLRADIRDQTHRHASSQYWLGEILSELPDLALEWLQCRLPELTEQFEPLSFDSDHDALACALRTLSTEQRVTLVVSLRVEEFLPHGFPLDVVLPILVDRRPAVYEAVLRRPDLREYFEFPLFGEPDSSWPLLVSLALDVGLTSAEIVRATVDDQGSRPFAPAEVGTGIERWQRWKSAFERVLDSVEQPEIRAIATDGIQECERRLNDARKNWRAIEVAGL